MRNRRLSAGGLMVITLFATPLSEKSAAPQRVINAGTDVRFLNRYEKAVTYP